MPSQTLLQTALTNPLSPKLPNQISTTVTDTLTGKKIAFAKLSDIVGDFATNAAIALLILVATLWLATWAARLTRAAMQRLPRVSDDVTLHGFIASLVRYAVITVGVIAILHRLGFETTSIITVLGAASLAVGLALQGALSNVAAGVMILIFRPYRVGDMVTMAGKLGTVKRLDLFNTELSDPDGLKVVVPNGKGFGDVIINYTDIPRRRIQLKFGIDYSDPIEKAVQTILDLARADARIMPDPAPWCMVTELADSQVTLELRAWTSLHDYWITRFDMLRSVKEAFDAAGLTMPYPTQTSVSKDRPSAASTPAAGKAIDSGQAAAADPRAPPGEAPPAKPPQP
jgi:small conductance mechanosensitive channel